MTLAYDNSPPPRPDLANIEAEQALLGVILYRNEVFNTACGDLRPEDFSEAIHARIFEATAYLIQNGKVASPITLKTTFERDSTLAEIGGAAYLARLAGSASSPLSAPGYAEAIKGLALRRTLRTLAEQAVYDVENLPIDRTPEDFIADFAQGLSSLAGGQGTRQTRADGKTLAAIAVDSAAAAYQGGGDPDAIPSGLRALDAKIGGLHRGELIIIGARPSMGKSALGIALAVSAGQRGIPTAFLSLEMTKKQVGHRALSMAAHARGVSIPYYRISEGKFSEPEYQHLVEAAHDMAAWKMVVDEREALSAGAIRSAVMQIKTKNPDLAVVVVDYLGLVQVTDRYRGMKVYELAEVSAALKGLAKAANVAVVALHQLNRGLEGRDNKRPTLADLRESGAIEQDADMVIFPYREEYYASRALEAVETGSKEEVELSDRLRKCAGVMELIVAKNRQGPIGTVRVKANMACNVIEDFEALAPIDQEELRI